jgi:hypothetical protein
MTRPVLITSEKMLRWRRKKQQQLGLERARHQNILPWSGLLGFSPTNGAEKPSLLTAATAVGRL